MGAPLNDPYAPPQSEVGDPKSFPQQFGGLFWIIATGTTLLSIGLGLIGSFVVPAFERLFDSFGFGADLPLPAPTILVMQSRNLLWLAALAAAGLWISCLVLPFRLRFRSRIAAGFILLGVIAGCVMVFTLWALYLPSFTLVSQ